MNDLLIHGATVIDGTGGAPQFVDVAVRDGRISAVEMQRTGTAARGIDGRGRVLAPGFIDIHTHSDFTLPLNPMAEAKVRQGVTTEVVGNCGFSVAPALPEKAELLADYLSASAPSLPFAETDFGNYMAAWPAIAVNTVMQVHTTRCV
jgi:N-acyl-D-amino-acid deacylase